MLDGLLHVFDEGFALGAGIDHGGDQTQHVASVERVEQRPLSADCRPRRRRDVLSKLRGTHSRVSTRLVRDHAGQYSAHCLVVRDQLASRVCIRRIGVDGALIKGLSRLRPVADGLEE